MVVGTNSLESKAQLSLIRDDALMSVNGNDVLGALPVGDLLNGLPFESDNPLSVLLDLIANFPDGGEGLPGFDDFPGVDELQSVPVLSELVGVIAGEAPHTGLPGFDLSEVPVVIDLLSALVELNEGSEDLFGDIPLLGDLLGLI
jgi:hypothetical protein